MSGATQKILEKAETLNINDGEVLIVKIDMKLHGQLSWGQIDNIRMAFGDTKVLIADKDMGFSKMKIEDLGKAVEGLKK